MKRWALRILLLLILGALVNVAVAWSSALARAGGTKTELTPEAAQAELQAAFANALRFSEGVPASGSVLRSARLEQRNAMAFVDENGMHTFVSTERLDSGWPLPSLSGTTLVWGSQRKESFGLIESTWPVAGIRQRVLLPTRPLWPGFAINTMFYAVVLWGGWLLFAGAFELRRRRRRIRRGLCPKCAYDLRGRPQGSACPECGSIVAS